jgi:CRP-like cAMP-binding protein
MAAVLNKYSDSLYEVPFVKEINFSPEELFLFEKFMEVKAVNKGETILSPGEEETHFRFLNKGLIRQYYFYNGREICVHFAQKNEIVCSFASYTAHGPTKYFIEAIVPSVLLCFRKTDMDFIMSEGIKYTQFGKLLMTQLCNQKEQREMDLLNYDGLGRLQYFVKTEPELFEQLPQKYIASYLNIKQETLSTLKKKLKNGNVCNYSPIIKYKVIC